MRLDEKYRIHSGLDIFFYPCFASQLDCDSDTMLDELDGYPTIGRGDQIKPGAVQWVAGDNAALKYRGHPLNRTKILLQSGDPNERCVVYSYTGLQYRLLRAQANVADCPEVAPVFDMYNEWCRGQGYQTANHVIVTKYRDGRDCIGHHSDKELSIAASNGESKSLITVLKIGEHSRPFEVSWKNKKGEPPNEPFYRKVVPPGAAIIMTLEANNKTTHSVPASECGTSGSIVFRTITTTISAKDLENKILKANYKDGGGGGGGGGGGDGDGDLLSQRGGCRAGAGGAPTSQVAEPHHQHMPAAKELCGVILPFADWAKVGGLQSEHVERCAKALYRAAASVNGLQDIERLDPGGHGDLRGLSPLLGLIDEPPGGGDVAAVHGAATQSLGSHDPGRRRPAEAEKVESDRTKRRRSQAATKAIYVSLEQRLRGEPSPAGEPFNTVMSKRRVRKGTSTPGLFKEHTRCLAESLEHKVSSIIRTINEESGTTFAAKDALVTSHSRSMEPLMSAGARGLVADANEKTLGSAMTRIHDVVRSRLNEGTGKVTGSCVDFRLKFKRVNYPCTAWLGDATKVRRELIDEDDFSVEKQLKLKACKQCHTVSDPKCGCRHDQHDHPQPPGPPGRMALGCRKMLAGIQKRKAARLAAHPLARLSGSASGSVAGNPPGSPVGGRVCADAAHGPA